MRSCLPNANKTCSCNHVHSRTGHLGPLNPCFQALAIILGSEFVPFGVRTVLWTNTTSSLWGPDMWKQLGCGPGWAQRQSRALIVVTNLALWLNAMCVCSARSSFKVPYTGAWVGFGETGIAEGCHPDCRGNFPFLVTLPPPPQALDPNPVSAPLFRSHPSIMVPLTPLINLPLHLHSSISRPLHQPHPVLKA